MTRVILVFVSFFLTVSLKGAILTLPDDFIISPEISRRVDFWEKIFLKYPSTSSVIHDIDHAELLVDVLDFDALAKKKNVKEISMKSRERITDAYLDRYELAIKRFRHFGKDALKHGLIEQRLWHVYSRSPEMLEDLLKGKAKLRAQGGLSDVFLKAAHRAQFYLPYMEHIFQSNNIPPVITRLPFVESMFNLNAKSKQGAVGIWQFMRTTAKQYMKVDKMVDERVSPFKATRAAARYLKNAHEEIKAWPLTITSYNYGVNGILRAINNLNTRNIDVILNHHKSAAFQYASKNFYSEFIAAVLVYNHLVGHGGISKVEGNDNIQSFILTKPLDVADLISASEISEEIFKKYNPCIKDVVYSRYRRKKLPVPYEIFLPSKLAGVAQKHLNKKYTMATQTGMLQ